MNLDAMYKLTHGLYVLGAKDGQRYVGSIVDAVMQVASQPVAVALSCTNTSYTKSCIDQTGEFSLSVLCRDVDPFVVANFGFQTSRKVNKWDNVAFYEEDGLPYVKDNLATFRCKVLHKFPLQSNTLFVAEVISAESARNDPPLTYLDYRSYFKKDVMDSFAKYTEQQKGKKMADNGNKKWVCTVCGYVYDGEIPFEELPDDYVCPLCGVGKELFELQEV